MKNFSRPKVGIAASNHFHCRQEGIGDRKLYEDLMFPQCADGCFENVKLEGRTTGASLITRGGNSGESRDCCSINIYISNNVQGVNNSVLVGSNVNLGDPGVYLSFEGLKLDNKGFQKSSKKKGSDFSQGMCWMLLVVLVITSLFLNLT